MKARLKAVLPTISASAALTTALLLATAPIAAAAPVSRTTQAAQRLQAQIDAQIAAYGGTQVSPYEVAYDGGNVIMVFADPVTGALPTSSADRVELGRVADAGRPGVAAQVSPLTTSYRYGCPYTSTTGWTCFYQNISFNHNSCSGTGACGDGGVMLEFDVCGYQSLAAYGFSDQTSSWVNNTDSYVTVYDASSSLLWSESSGTASSYVGSANNDKANSFWLIC